MGKYLNYSAISGILFLATQLASAQVYEVPPSSTVSHSVPVISDEAMRECIILYSNAKALKSVINTMSVDQYSQMSIDVYNTKVNRHSQMINRFNRDCAGKQSESAYREAQKLNRGN